MALNLKLNIEEIEQEQEFGGRIDRPGAYVGTITKAYDVVSEGGAEGLRLDFLSDNGQDGNGTIWHIKKDGTENPYGMADINRIMYLLDIKELKPRANQPVDVYDFDLGATVTKKMTVYPQIIGGRIGILFKLGAEYNGKQRIEMSRFFDAETRQTASEKAKGLDAVKIDKELARIFADEDKAIVKKADGQPKAQSISTKSTPASDEFDDDIPF